MSRQRPGLPLPPPPLPLLLLLLLMMVISDITTSVPTGTMEATERPVLTSPVNRLTCYFCENVENNHICNRFAIDHPCPAGTSFCRTLHIMDNRGGSLVVNKHCAADSECAADSVGCLQEDHQKTCVSCCHSSYCNEPVPTNYSNAVRELKPTAPTRAVKAAGGAAPAPPATLLLLLLITGSAAALRL